MLYPILEPLLLDASKVGEKYAKIAQEKATEKIEELKKKTKGSRKAE